MNPAPITLPPHLISRISVETTGHLVGVGNAALLDEALLGFIASRACPASMLIETLDLVPQWVREGRVLISGFHSPLEQQVLTSLLRREGHAVRVLARHLSTARGYRASAGERDALAQGRLLILSASPSVEIRTTRASAMTRNRLVLALASEHVALQNPTRNPSMSQQSQRTRS